MPVIYRPFYYCINFFSGCFYYFNSTINPVLYSVMSHRFRVAFRENFCVDNPVICCWRWWRDHHGYGTSSVSTSHRTPRADLHVPQQQPINQASLMTNLRDKIQPVELGRFVGMSHSDEKRKEMADMHKPHFSSDPNFSLRLPVMCVDFSPSGNSNYELARELESIDGKYDECMNCTSYQNAHHTKMQPIYSDFVKHNPAFTKDFANGSNNESKL